MFRPANDFIIHQITDFLGLPFGYDSFLMKYLLIDNGRTHIIFFVCIKERLNHSCLGIFRHEFPLQKFDVIFHRRRKGHWIVSASVDLHCLRPCLDNVCSGFCFIFIYGGFCFFRKYPDRGKPPVPGTIKREKI